MIICPHPGCEDADAMETFEVTTLYGLTGSRMYLECPNEHRIEVDVVVRDSATARPSGDR